MITRTLLLFGAAATAATLAVGAADARSDDESGRLRKATFGRIHLPQPPAEGGVAGVASDTCDDPGPDTVLLNGGDDLTLGGVACNTGGITTANTYARVITGFSTGEIRCVTFGFRNSGPDVPATLGIYRDLDGGAPTAVGIDLELVSERAFTLPQTAGNVFVTAQFDEPICLDDLTDQLVVVLDIAAQTAGFATFAGNDLSETGPTYVVAAACNINSFVTLASLNFPDRRWVVSVNGDLAQCGGGGTPCPEDLNEDGTVDGADLGLLLANWGFPGIGDFDGSGDVGPEDLADLIGHWGNCP